jgi:hypothetical protein
LGVSLAEDLGRQNLVDVVDRRAFVPTQEWTRRWTDEDLYAKYGLSEGEIAFIEKVVRPMEFNGDGSDE